MPRSERKRARLAGLCSVSAVTALAIFAINARAEQPPAPCHPNPTADADETAVRSRGDVVNLPVPLQDRLAQLANRPHTYLPLQVFNEADGASQLFQYYLLDTTGFEPNVFTAIIPGVNDGNVQLTATGGNCGLETVGAVRVVLEPKPGLPTDPEKPRADLKRPWEAVSKRAGLNGVRLHDLRHTYASFGAGGGVGLPIIGKLLGHSQPSTTARYAHLDNDPLRRGSEHIGSRLAAAMGDLKPQTKGEVIPMHRKRRGPAGPVPPQ